MRKLLYSRPARLVGILVLCFSLACSGLLSGIRSGWAATKPFITSLVTTGVITQERADAATRDVDEVLDKGDVAEQCVNDIPPDLQKNERKVKKAHCYFQFAKDFRVILQRHNIGGNAQLDRIAIIGEGFILALEQYFHRVTGSAVSRGVGVMADPDKKLKSDLDAKLKELKAATQH